MIKLFKLKEWVTLTDAAKYLSLSLDEEVSQVDLLRLVLDKHLTLSVLFVNKVPAKKGKKIPYSEVLFKEIPSLFNENVTIQIPDSIEIINNYFKDKFYIKLEDEIFLLSGIYDLPLIGNDRIDIERLYYEQINGTDLDYICLDGAFVECYEVIYQIQERFEDGFIEKMRGDENHSRDNEFFPAGRLPEDAALVFRTNVLREFVESLSEKKPQQPNKTAETVTKNTLLKMIITMATGGYGYNINDSKSPTPKEISKDAEKIRLSISDDTVRKWLSESAELLDQSPE